MSEAAPSTRRIPLAVRVLLGVAVGTAIGVAFGTSYTGPLGDIGLLVVRLLKALAAPLIFVCVIDAILRTRIAARAGLTLVVISLVNAAVATGIGLSMGAVMKPEKGALLELVKKKEDASSSTAATTAAPSTPKKADEVDPTLDPLKNLGGYVPENLVDPFRKNAVISIVLLALLVGAALRAVKERGEEQAQRGVQLIEDATHAVLVTFTKLLGWVIEIVPFAVLGVVASVVGKSGIDVFRQLGLFLFTCLAGLSLQALVWYSLLLLVVGRTSPLKFFAGAFDAIVTALSCSSSLATLPVTLRCLDKMKVSPASARLAACVGTNLNHDGIILYEAAAAIFIAQGFGYEISAAGQVTIALSSVMAGIGIAGVPEAGLITLPLVLAAAGLPVEVVAVVVPLILPVDWILGRCRAATNVISDMTVATLLDRFHGA